MKIKFKKFKKVKSVPKDVPKSHNDDSMLKTTRAPFNHLLMSTYTKFAIISAGNLGKFIINKILKLKVYSAVSSVTLVTCSVHHTSHESLAEPPPTTLFIRELVIQTRSQRASTTLPSTMMVEPSTFVDAFRGVGVMISVVS